MKTLTGPKVIARQSPPNYTREMSLLDAHMPMSAWGTHVQTCTPQNDTWEHGQSSGYIKNHKNNHENKKLGNIVSNNSLDACDGHGSK